MKNTAVVPPRTGMLRPEPAGRDKSDIVATRSLLITVTRSRVRKTHLPRLPPIVIYQRRPLINPPNLVPGCPPLRNPVLLQNVRRVSGQRGKAGFRLVAEGIRLEPLYFTLCPSFASFPDVPVRSPMADIRYG